MEIVRDMMNSNNKEKEHRYVIIATVNGVKETVTALMSMGRVEARQSCIDQLTVIEGL